MVKFIDEDLEGVPTRGDKKEGYSNAFEMKVEEDWSRSHLVSWGIKVSRIELSGSALVGRMIQTRDWSCQTRGSSLTKEATLLKESDILSTGGIAVFFWGEKHCSGSLAGEDGGMRATDIKANIKAWTQTQ